jgi:3-isopropylmalate dehydrogenase
MNNPLAFRIAVLPGDGIGPEVMNAALLVLEAATAPADGIGLRFEIHPAGAVCYQETGNDLPATTLQACREADAVLLGAMGLPDVRKDDGTEINPQLDLRFELDLYAGVRPVRLLSGVPGALADPRTAEIDMVVIREQTEGLFADIRSPAPAGNNSMSDRCLITREGTKRVSDFALDLARRRNRGGLPRVTCVDKANVLHSMAFFRKVFDECAANTTEVAADHAYIDAFCLDLVRAPWGYDVVVMENLLGDIVSDLAAGLIGGMGFAPSADLGDRHGLFQPAHGTAPDIAGKGIANPTAMILSAAMMLEWLGERHQSNGCTDAADKIRRAVETVYADGIVRPPDIGGTDGTDSVTSAVIEAL